MSSFELASGNALDYDYMPPTAAGGFTFVCFNALTGDKEMWKTSVAGPLTSAGHGLLLYNLRGQAGSPSTADGYTVQSIVEDALKMIEHVGPARPVHVGLSIGGLFALMCHLAGGSATAHGLVLINTLRRNGARLEWLNDAVATAAAVGGPELLRDLYGPLLFNEEWLRSYRHNFLKGDYRPLDPSDDSYLLLKAGNTADWDVPYEQIEVPVLVVSGLQDRVFFDRQDVEHLLDRLPDAEAVEMPDAGHMIPAERPERLAEAIVAFGQKLHSRTAG